MMKHAALKWYRRLSAVRRLALSILIASAAFFLLPASMRLEPRLLAAWNLSVMINLGLTWMVIARAGAAETRASAERQDPSSIPVLVFVIAATIASSAAIVFMLKTAKGLSAQAFALRLLLAASTVALSWLLIHTRFAFHYAHLYYRRHDEKLGVHTNPGLTFPGNHPPDYLDFIYFAFVIGMTSQVADVCTASRAMRRLALAHGLVAFIYNMAILALSINILSSLI